MGTLPPRILAPMACVAAWVASACVEPAPPYDDWMAMYVAHGPLVPTDEVEAMEQVTSSPYDERFPAVSRDGAGLLFVSGWFYLDHSIEAADILGLQTRDPRTVETVVGGAGFALSPAWEPDGGGFLYATDAEGAWQLVRSRADGSEREVIVTDDPGRPIRPSVSPDASRFAFSIVQGGSRHIAVSRLDGSEVRVLGPGDHPSWSPTGDEIYFQGADELGHTQLFAVHPDTGPAQQRTFGAFSSVHPSHDPGGEYVVSGATRGSEARTCKVCCGLYVMRTDGTRVVQLVGGDVDADWPTWGGDGWIYFATNVAGDYDVWRVRWRGETGATGRTPAQPSQR